VEEYPVVKVKGGKARREDVIYRGKKAREFIEELGKKYGTVYIIDVDGYRKNSPNLSFYKKISIPIWIDSFPRYVEDVMDLVISGFEKISIWNMNDGYLGEIKDMCDVDIFIGEEAEEEEAARKASRYGFKGIILEEEQKKVKELEAWKIYMKDWMVRRIS